MCLSEEQRYYFKFMVNYLKFNIDQIRSHPSMINSKTNKPFQKRSLQVWFDRLQSTGNVYTIPKTGRPKKLSPLEEKLLISTIKENPKQRFKNIRALGFRQIGVRSVNRYANRNGYRKYLTPYI